METVARGVGERASHLAELLRHRELLFMLTYRDIRIRYKQSVMGMLWALLMPCVIMLGSMIVRYAFSVVSGVPLQSADLASVAVRALPWAFTVSALRFATNSLTLNETLVTKIYFPKEVIPLSAVLACAFDASIAAAALTIMLLIIGFSIGPLLLWVPALALMLMALVTGAALVTSAAGLFFRDVKFLVEVMLTFGVFFTPVFYKVQMFDEHGMWLMLNPVTPIIESLDAVIIAGQPPNLLWLSYSFVVAAVLCIGGYRFFKRVEPLFAELI